MSHKNFYKFKAKDNFGLGLLMGKKFSSVTKQAVTKTIKTPDWQIKVLRAKNFLRFNKQYFPQYIEELQGYAKGAGVNFLDLYTLSLEDEVDPPIELGASQNCPQEKCTTLITNGGKLLAHNEDWDKGSENKICVVQKTIGNATMLELFYYDTLGGNSVGINSNGYIVAVNSMMSTDAVPPAGGGVSKNFVARWLSETKDPDSDISKLKTMERSQGHNINILYKSGALWNIEYTSHQVVASRQLIPFVHSNHYLSKLSMYEANTNKNGTFDRYKTAKEKIKPQMNAEEATALMSDESSGKTRSIMNERTIAKIVVDLKKNVAKVWLLRETELGFVDYEIKSLTNERA